ncbi:MAG TPA: CorA family divalent cation transporter [Candidatus Limnocylindria bacterium]
MSIEAILSRADGSDQPVDLGSWTPRKIARDQLLWIDLVAPTDDELSTVRHALALQDDAVASLSQEPGAPGARVRRDGVDVVVQAPGERLDDEPRQLRVFVGDEWVITCHREPLRFLEEHRRTIQDQREVGRLTPVEFLVSILDWHVDAFFAAAEALEEEVDDLDDAALGTEADLLRRLVEMRRRISGVRRMLSPHREVYAELSRPDFLAGMDDRERDALHAVAARLDRAADAVGNARDMLIGTFDVHMTRTAQRTNDVMKVLTLASVVLLPAVVLAGVMGMNFRVAFFDDPNMFWLVIAVMVVLAVGTVVAVRWRGWL